MISFVSDPLLRSGNSILTINITLRFETRKKGGRQRTRGKRSS